MVDPAMGPFRVDHATTAQLAETERRELRL
jgi:hypothetical protein